LILEGARHWNMSADYIAMLETIDTVGHST